MVLWVNLHGSFMFGVALALYVAAEAVLSPGSQIGRADEMRRWGGFVIAAMACAFLNANGIDGLLEPFRITAMPTLQTSFIEWRSPDFQKFDPAEAWLLAAILLGFSTGVRLPPMRLLLLLGLFHLVLQHQRHEDLLAVVAPLALIGPLAERLNAITKPEGGSPVSRLFAMPPARAAAPAIGTDLGGDWALRLRCLPASGRTRKRGSDAVRRSGGGAAGGLGWQSLQRRAFRRLSDFQRRSGFHRRPHGAVWRRFPETLSGPGRRRRCTGLGRSFGP